MDELAPFEIQGLGGPSFEGQHGLWEAAPPALRTAAQDLLQIKRCLVDDLRSNRRVSYRVNDGLGAICISAVERHVSPLLLSYDLATEVVLREYPDAAPAPRDCPRVHCYNVVRSVGGDFVVDIDADPFAGRNTGVVVAPLDAPIALYREGYVKHCRALRADGSVGEFAFWLSADQQYLPFLRGRAARFLSLSQFFGAPEDGLCPLVLPSGAVLYFGLLRYMVGTGPTRHRIYCTLVSGEVANWDGLRYELTVADVASIAVSRDLAGNDIVVVKQQGERRLDFILSNPDGCLMASDAVRFRAATASSDRVHRVRIDGKCPTPITLPALPEAC